MTSQAPETKSPSVGETTKFTIFPDYYAISDQPLIPQRNALKQQITDLNQQLTMLSLNPNSEACKSVAKNLHQAQNQLDKVNQNIKLSEYLSDPTRQSRYEKFYAQILEAAPSKGLEKQLLSQWQTYNRSMDSVKPDQSSTYGALKRRITPPATSMPTPAEQKPPSVVTRVIPRDDDPALRDAFRNSELTFLAEDRRRKEQRQQVEGQKQLKELLENYSGLKKEYAAEDIAIFLEEPLKKLNLTLPQLESLSSKQDTRLLTL